MSNFEKSLHDCQAVIGSLSGEAASLRAAADRCLSALSLGGKLMVCGNGGSAAEAMHLTGELVGRYKESRRPLSAITLGTDPAVLTCIGNDFSFQDVFSRQVRAIGRSGDVLIAFSTSGRSSDILAALETAREMDISTVCFLGRDGCPALALSDYSLLVRHNETARIQEGHQFLMHCLMDIIEEGI
jgi:D-sedoheptulose 7-phosphate isomerase